MSVSPIYIKSENGSLDLRKNQNDLLYLRRISDYSPYEFTIYPITDQSAPNKTNFPGEYDRAITVNSIISVNNNVTFNNLIRIYEDGKVEQNISNSWTPRVDYFSSSYTGPKVYLNNLYQSIINDIKNNTVDTSKPRRYMLYGPTGEQRSVTNITRQNGYYRFFVTGIGGTDFNENTGLPLRSVDINSNIIPLTYVVYKYDGYSQFTNQMYYTIFTTIKNTYWSIGDVISPGFAGKKFDLNNVNVSSLREYIDKYNIYITRGRDTSNTEKKVEWIWVDYGMLVRLAFFSNFGAPFYEGVSYNGLLYKAIYGEEPSRL